MPQLHDEAFIVRSLARYDTPSQVADAVKAQFNVAVSRQQVYRDDPDNADPPSQRWRELHATTRRAFLRELAEIGVAHKAVARLRMVDRFARDAEANNFGPQAAAFTPNLDGTFTQRGIDVAFTDAIQSFTVKRLACFDTPPEGPRR